jgi:hypothetical protein
MIEIKQHDTSRTFTDTLVLDGLPINLSGATVSLLFKSNQTLLTTRRTATIGSPATGEVSYQPIAADVAYPGTFNLEWEIVFPDLKQLTVPSSGYIELKVNQDLG